MLRNALLRSATAALTLLVSALATAQGLTPESMGTGLSAEERAKFEELARVLQEEALRGAQDPRAQEEAVQMARRVDAIANPEMARERDKVLRFLGIDPESEHALYIFVSWSMPLEVLRAYAVEAMWTGATLVFRGVPPGRSIPDFFLQDLSQLVWDKGASAAISIDPRLYDAYRITMAPTIVLTRTRDNLVCVGAGERHVTPTASFDLCPPVDDTLYLKLSGSVTLDYALETFRSQGWNEAEVYLAALRRGYPPGVPASKEQQPFTGEWKDAISPQDLMRRQELLERTETRQ